MGATSAALLFQGCDFGSEQAKPNVVLIMADDLGAECLRCYGGESYETPVLDQLAADGMRSNNAYCTPLCTPTRVQVMTGQYPFRTGWTGGIWNQPEGKQFLDPDRFNFARMLKDAGYVTAVAGKWQLARFETRPQHPRNIGFDASCLWTWLYSEATGDLRLEGEEKPSRYWDPGVWRNGSFMPDTRGKFGPDIYTDFLIDFIHAHKSDPFFVYFPMALTHWPFVPVPGVEGNKDGTRTPPLAQQYFADMVEYMDMLVGRLVQTLNDAGLRDKTLILFTGDNGTAEEIRSEFDSITIPGGKGTLTDAGTRVPLIANWPGTVPGGVINRDLLDFTDIVPTLAELAGADISGRVTDGVSFLPQLRGRSGQPRDWIFCQVGDDWFIRDKRYRLRKDGEFADMINRYDPEIVAGELSAEARQAKENLQKSLNQLMQI